MASPASSSPAYGTLQGQARYQSYLQLRDAIRSGKPVNEKLLANKVRNLSDLIRARGSLRYRGGSIRSEIEEARALRNELLLERNRRGIEPEEPPPPPLPVSQQPVRTPFGTFQPRNTPYQQIERGRGNIGSSARRNIAALEKTQAAPTEIHLTSTPLAGPGLSPIEKAESFVGGINAMYEGRQVLIANRQGDTYSVQYNPALARSGVQDLTAERLTALGFTELDGKFVYTEPSYEIFEEDYAYPSASGFDFSKEPSVIFAEPEPEPIAVPPAFDFTEPYFKGEPQKVNTFLTEFFETDYSGEAAKVAAQYDPFKAQTPFGEVSLAAPVVKVLGSVIESPVKAGAAVGNLLFRGFDAESRERNLNPYTVEERNIISSELVASGPDLIFAPITTVFTVGTLGELSLGRAGAKAIGAKAIAPKEPARQLVSTTINEERTIIREFSKGSLRYSIQTPVGGPGYSGLARSLALEPLRQGAIQLGKSAGPVAKIAGGAVRTGVIFGGTQAGVEIFAESAKAGDFSKGIEALKNPDVQERIKTSAIAGAVLGGGLETYSQAKPFFGKAATRITDAGKTVLNAPDIAMKTGIGLAERGYEGAKLAYFLAHSDRGALRQVSAPTPLSFRAIAKVTELGGNPFELVKPRPAQTRTREIVSPAPSRRFSPIPIVQPRYSFPLTRSSKTRTAMAPPSELRQERIREDIATDILTREAGRTRTEQFAALRERTGTGIRPRVQEREAEKLIFGERTRTAVNPIVGFGEPERLKIGTPERIRLKVPQKEKVGQPPAIPFIGFKFGHDEDRRSKPKAASRPRKRGYAPSIYGIEYNITTTKIPKGIIGPGVRAVVIGRRRRK